MINIEICKSENKVGTWDMEIGVTDGFNLYPVDNVYNMDKNGILELISKEMDNE